MQTLSVYAIIVFMEHNDPLINLKYIDLIELDPEEKLVCTIRRHFIGLLGVYLTGMFIAVAVLGGSVLLSSWIGSNITGSNSNIEVIVIVVGLVFSAVLLFFTYVAGYVFRNSVIIVTTDKVAQILYRNLVDRKISQLSLGDLQDVTVDQRGLLSRLFKYGTLVIETAGEQNNFTFTFTPLPYKCAREIVGAREASIKKYGN